MDLKVLTKEIANRLNNSNGIRAFCQHRAQGFENWIQVEACGILVDRGVAVENIMPERENTVDICFIDNHEKYAIELKVLIAHNVGVSRKETKASDLNLTLNNLKKLEKMNQFGHRATILVTYPLDPFSKREIEEFKKKKNYEEICKMTTNGFNDGFAFYVEGTNNVVTKGAVYLLQPKCGEVSAT